MGFIQKINNPFVHIKLTDIGREQLAKGKLNFKSYAIGDSEINYDLVDKNTKVLAPKDRQPNLRSVLLLNGSPFLNIDDVGVKKIRIANEALERGTFLSAATIDAYLPDPLLFKPMIEDGDFSLNLLGNRFYVYKQGLDNRLPLGAPLGNYPGIGAMNEKESIDFYDEKLITAYWDSGALKFQNSASLPIKDVPVFNFNVLCDENHNGLDDSIYRSYYYYTSRDKVGVKNPYYGYSLSYGSLQQVLDCNCDNVSLLDPVKKCVGIIHYTNNCTANFYGEYFYIDSDKRVEVKIPTVLWHGRKFMGSGTGTGRGMIFVSSDVQKLLPNSDLIYHDLVEHEDYSQTPSSPIVVGKVFPQMKMIVLEDQELVAAMTHKSNRNFTLPYLEATLIPPVPTMTGDTIGLLNPGETIYLTYELRGVDGLNRVLPNQNVIKITNKTGKAKDVAFNIYDVDKLPYMNLVGVANGFSATEFWILGQIVSDVNLRPSHLKYKEINFTTPALGVPIDPVKLENQNYYDNDFILTQMSYSGASFFLPPTELDLPKYSEPYKHHFGDESLFFGNIATWIGANIYRTIIPVQLNGADFTSTTNPTKDTSLNISDFAKNANFWMSEIGVYDDLQNLVLIAKLAEPVELKDGNSIVVEISYDF